MKLIAISDTHGKHAGLVLPPGDILIHAGDVSMKGEEQEVMDFLQWFGAIEGFQYKIFIAGNHDFYFERNSEEHIRQVIPPGIIYLNNSGTSVKGLKIWGSPVTPWFMNWAFNVKRGDPIRRYWDLIPDDTDILITHGPPFGILDANYKGEHLGCKDLLNRVRELKPKLHIFGHIHESYGEVQDPSNTFINASILNEKYELANKPVLTRTIVKSWDWLRVEIEKLRHKMKIPDTDFRPLGLQEWEPVWNKIYFTFFNGTSGWLWEDFKLDAYSIGEMGHTNPLLPFTKLVEHNEKVWLFLDGRLNGKTKFWFYEGFIEPAMAVIGETWQSQEIFVVSKKYDWLLCLNHHDCFMATGTSMVEKLQQMEHELLNNP